MNRCKTGLLFRLALGITRSSAKPPIYSMIMPVCYKFDTKGKLVLALFRTDDNAINKAAWWRHQIEAFSAILAICAGNSPVTGEFPSHRPATRSFDVFFELCLNKRLCKQSWGWWFETPLRHHYDVSVMLSHFQGAHNSRGAVRMRCEPLSEPMLKFCSFELKSKFQWNLKRNQCIYFQENASENIVCEMEVVLFRPQFVDVII